MPNNYTRATAELIPLGDYYGDDIAGSNVGQAGEYEQGDTWFYWEDMPAGLVYVHIDVGEVPGYNWHPLHAQLAAGTPTDLDWWTMQSFAYGGWDETISFFGLHPGGALTLVVDGGYGWFGGAPFTIYWGHELDTTPSHWGPAVDETPREQLVGYVGGAPASHSGQLGVTDYVYNDYQWPDPHPLGPLKVYADSHQTEAGIGGLGLEADQKEWCTSPAHWHGRSDKVTTYSLIAAIPVATTHYGPINSAVEPYSYWSLYPEYDDAWGWKYQDTDWRNGKLQVPVTMTNDVLGGAPSPVAEIMSQGDVDDMEYADSPVDLTALGAPEGFALEEGEQTLEIPLDSSTVVDTPSSWLTPKAAHHVVLACVNEGSAPGSVAWATHGDHRLTTIEKSYLAFENSSYTYAEPLWKPYGRFTSVPQGYWHTYIF